MHLDPDTAMNPHSLHAALRAAGAAVLATDLVTARQSRQRHSAACGRRATTPAARGRWASASSTTSRSRRATRVHAHGLERVAIIDFDVHHGNGTEDIFENDPHVLMASTFQHPFYPYSGTEDPARNMVNVPLRRRRRVERVPRGGAESTGCRRSTSFKPQLVLFSAGFDAHAEDDMAMLRLADADYGWVTEQVKAVAERYAQGRMVSMLEGGYALSALARSVVQHIRVLAGLNA